MRFDKLLGFLAVLASLVLFCGPANAQETCTGGTCVSSADMDVFKQLLKDKKCQATTPPTVTLDPVTIVVDQDGRVYGSGADPKPYSVHIVWCNYTMDATGKVTLVVAKREPPNWGFRYRLKFTAGYLPVQALQGTTWYDGVDAGLLHDVLYWKWLNLNFATGIRSSGVGLGADITRNFGVYAGYALAYSGLRSTPYAGLYFSFW